VSEHLTPTSPDTPTAPDTPTSPDADAAPRRTRVAVLFGGRSGEHGISAVTAAGVLSALDREKYDVVPIGITREGKWVVTDDDPQHWQIADGRVPEVTAGDDTPEVVLSLAVGDPRLRVLEPGRLPSVLSDVDVVFPLLHGPFGEDGTLQGLLEFADVRYVGAGLLASALGMDKHFMKLVLEGYGIPAAPWTVIKPRDWAEDPERCLAAADGLGLPLFVKPCRAGSSLGVSRVVDRADLRAAIVEAQRHDPKVLVETGIVGREIECAVLGGRAGGRPRASLPAEITMESAEHAFYDFEAKYIDGSAARLTCPADLPEHLVAAVQETAVRTFEALECEGLARVDVFVMPDDQVIVNEINTMPGFTPISMFPRMWAESGIAYPELVDELIQLALERPTGLR